MERLCKRCLKLHVVGLTFWLLITISSCSRSSFESGDASGTGGKSVESTSTGGKSSGFSSSGGKKSGGEEGTGGKVEIEGGGGATGGLAEPGSGGTDGLGGLGGTTGDPSPTLNSLTIEGGAVAMRPQFSPDIRRYAVRAADPQQVLKVSAEAHSNFEITIAGRQAKSGETVSLTDQLPGTEIDITVGTQSDDTEKYEIVYLPNDFPDFAVTTLEPGASSDPLYLTLRPIYNYVVKADNHGVPLFYLKSDSDPIDFKRHDDGRMSYAATVSGGERVLMNQDFGVVDQIKAVGIGTTDRHDFTILKNGNFVVLGKETIVRDVTEFGGAEDQKLDDFVLQEITPERKVVFAWNTWDHLKYDEAINLARYPQDYVHINSLSVDDDGNWMVSSRNMSKIVKIDRQSGEVIWTLGGIGSDFQFADDPFGGFCGQHHATWSGPNRILLFDNGATELCHPEREEVHTRAVEYEIDEQSMVARMVWSHAGPKATSQGSAQRLPNGNTLIGWGSSFEKIATEVDPQGKVVFEISSDVRVASYRTLRFPE